MKRRTTPLLCLLLALMMIFAIPAQASDLPIVEGNGETLSVVIGRRTNSGDADKVWFWAFAKEFMNITFEVEQTLDAQQYKNLSFAAGTMPDLYIDMQFTTSELMNYGVSEKQLVDLAPYITTDLMPNLCAILEENAGYRDWIAAPNGGIYSIGNFGNPKSPGSIRRMFINQTWLDEAGLEVPTTLDEFTAMLYAFKERGDDIVPLGGGYGAANPSLIILNALGYIITASTDEMVGLRNGEVVLPYGDREMFGEYLRIMHDYYVNGLISQDYYTIDNTTARALIAENRVGVIGEPAYLSVPTTFADWTTIKPLTSEWNETAKWPASANAVKIGGAAISANCKSIETAVKFLDWTFDMENYVTSIFGPSVDQEALLMGTYGGWYLNDTRNIAFVDVDNDTVNKYNGSVYDYRMGMISGWHDGVLGNAIDQYRAQQEIVGLDPQPQVYDLSDGDQHYRHLVDVGLMPYTDGVEIYPTLLFFSQEDNETLTDLQTVVVAHAKTESAKFVTGARNLDEVDSYFDELDKLGFQELLSLYQKAYN